MKLQMRFQVQDFEHRVDFLLYVHRENGRDVVSPLELKHIDAGLISGLPTFSLDRDEATDFLRSVMDVAWEMGVRPTGYDNDLGATKHHLDDMRRIVFKQLKMGG